MKENLIEIIEIIKKKWVKIKGVIIRNLKQIQSFIRQDENGKGLLNQKIVLDDNIIKKRDLLENELKNLILKYNELLKKEAKLKSTVKPYSTYFVKIMDTIIPFAGCRDKESFEKLKSMIRTCLDELYLIKRDLTEVPNLDQEELYNPYELSLNENMEQMYQLKKELEERIEELKKQCAPLEQKKCYKKILQEELWDIVKSIDSLREDATLDADKCIEIGNNLYKIFDKKQIDDLEFHWVDYQEFFSRSVKHMYVKGVAYPALYQCNTGEWKEKSPFDETGNPREGWDETILFYGGRK